jgi:hypothetical protein
MIAGVKDSLSLCRIVVWISEATAFHFLFLTCDPEGKSDAG